MAVTKMDFTQAFILNLQFIPGDLIKAFLAAFIAVKIKKTYPIIRK